MREGNTAYFLAVKPPISERESVYKRVRFLADSVQVLSDGSQLFTYTPHEFSEKGVRSPASKRGFMKMVRESMQQLSDEGSIVSLESIMPHVSERKAPELKTLQPVEV